ncbi:hypothetical protein M8J77_008067 [Diaphorina citri]|jgi:hypothetical protein|nr:hypothetical protein M8J77_008067 [Diaphorina citri]
MKITPREDPRKEWNNIKSVIIQKLNEKVGEKKKQPKKEWVTQMIEKMDERRKWKNVSSEYRKQQYRKLNNELRRESDSAREKWMQKQCQKIEELNKYCKLEEMYRVVKEVMRKKSSTINKRGMKKRDGMNTINEKENKELWEEYIKELYESSANVYLEEMENENEYNQEKMGYNIEEWEVKKALINDTKGESVNFLRYYASLSTCFYCRTEFSSKNNKTNNNNTTTTTTTTRKTTTYYESLSTSFFLSPHRIFV